MSAEAMSEDVTSESVDDRVRAEGLTLSQVRAAIPTALLAPSEVRSWAALARVCLTAAGCLWLLSQLAIDPAETGPAEWLALIGVWSLYGLVLVGLFVIGHDCGHGSFSRHRWLNTLIGYAVMSPMVNGFHTWRLTHNHHHAFTQLRGQEVDWGAYLQTEAELAERTWREDAIIRLGYALPLGIFLWIGWNTLRRGVMVRGVIGEDRYARERRALLVSNAIMLTCQLAITVGLLSLGGWWALLKFHSIPATIAGIFGAFIIAAGHASPQSLVFEEGDWTSARGQLSSTYTVRFPRIVEWLICDINVHIPHHVSVRIPWYRLRAANAALKAGWPGLVQERRFSLRELAWCVTTPVLEADPAHGRYRLRPRGR
ncbi:MAG: omega-6 fatty acid desaturase (delta-12 desaturase) [Myxococcota bacterium]|jgi:omega-6 fatty acid desaturase (delta-12 desaturase)